MRLTPNWLGRTGKLLLAFANTVVLGSLQFSPVNCCWFLPAQLFLASGPVGTHDHIFVLSRLLRSMKWCLLYEERRGLTTALHAPFTGESFCWCWASHSFTHSFLCMYLLLWNMFTEQLPSNSSLSQFHYSGFQLSCHNIYIYIYIYKDNLNLY
jgi:hypothetical protein